MSRDEYRIPASDTKGHSARHWFRSMPQMARQVEQIVSSRKFPYRTKGDLLRHALHRHVLWLAEQTKVSSVDAQVETIIELMRDEEMNSDFLLVFDKLAERISSHLSSGSQGEACRLIRIVQDNIKQMPDGYWRDRYTEQVKVKFGHLIESGKKANLGGVE